MSFRKNMLLEAQIGGFDANGFILVGRGEVNFHAPIPLNRVGSGFDDRGASV